MKALLIGAGSRGQQWAGVLRGLDAWDLGAIVEPRKGVLKKVLEENSLPASQGFGSLSEIGDASGMDWDAAVIATPPGDHVDPIRWAIDHGLPTLVEKPFATSLEEAKLLTEEAEAADIPLIVAQNYRYLRTTRTVHRVVLSGVLGNVSAINAHYYGPNNLPRSLLNVPHSAMWGMGLHHLDAFMHELQTPILSVCAISKTRPWTDQPAGATFEVLATAGNATITYSATYEGAGHEYFENGQGFSQRVIGDRGSLHVLHRWVFLAEKGRLPRPVRRGKRERSEEALLLDQLLRAIEDRIEPECSARENLRTMAVMEACKLSSHERRWIDIEEVWDGAT